MITYIQKISIKRIFIILVCSITGYASAAPIALADKPEFTFGDTIVCNSISLTGLRLIAGDTTGLTFTYYDAGFSAIEDPLAITNSGVYHIIGINADNLRDTSIVSITIQQPLNGTYTVGSVSADFSSLKEAATLYNSCGITANSTLVVTSDLTETATVEFRGDAPNSQAYSLTITSDGTRHTVSGAINGSLLLFTGANNIIIDGIIPADTNNLLANTLLFNNTYLTESASVHTLNMVKNGTSSGKGVRLRNTEFSMAQQLTAGGSVINSGIDSLFTDGCYIHNGYNGIESSGSTLVYAAIRNNVISAVNASGMYLLSTILNNIVITGNTVKDITPSGIGIKLYGIYADFVSSLPSTINISNNRLRNFQNTTAGPCLTYGINITGYNANITCNNNILDNFYSNPATTYGTAGIQIIQTSNTGNLQMLNDTVRNMNSELFTIGIFVNHVSSSSGSTQLQRLYVEKLSGKSVRSSDDNVVGIHLIGRINLNASTVTNLRNPNSSAVGIHASNVSGTTVTNCMISDIVSTKTMGILVSGNAIIQHNSIRLTNKLNDANEVTGINLGNRNSSVTSNITLQNNIISNEVTNGPAQNFILKLQPGGAMLTPTTCNNRYNIANGNIGMIVTTQTTQTGTIYTTLPQWSTSTNDNSRLTTPTFVAENDLHLTAPSNIDGRLHVPLLLTITSDLDNDSRVACINAAGADNFDPSVVFTLQNITVTLPACMNDSTQVNFEAIGGVMPYQYSLDGGSTYTAIPLIDSITQSGTIAAHFKAPLLAGIYTLSLKDNNNCTFVNAAFPIDTISQTAIPQTGTLFVKTTPSGKADGSSWDNAFDGKFLGWYLRNKAGNNTKIYVAQGSYIPYVQECDTVTDIRKYSFELNQDMHVRGGFRADVSGTDTTNSYDPKNYITRLSGEIQNDSDSTNNSYHVVTIAKNASVSLDGFYISGGYAFNTLGDNQIPYGANGGGIYDNGGNPSTRVVFSNLVVEHNAAKFGGGVYIQQNKASFLRNVIIEQNTNLSINYGGAGIFAWGNFLLENSTVNNNNHGSGIVSWGGDMLIRNSTISNNGKHGIEADNSSFGSWLRVGLFNSTVSYNSNTGVYLGNYKPDSLTFSFDNTLIVNNTNNANFSSGSERVDTTMLRYSIIGNTKYNSDFHDTSVLLIPVSLAPADYNGGWGKTCALPDPCENPAVQSGNPDYSGLTAQNLAIRSNPPCIGAYDGLYAILVTITTPNDTTCEQNQVTISTGTSVPPGTSIQRYEWYKDGNLLPSESGATLTFPGIAVSDAGKYTVLVKTDDPDCSRMSDTVTLNVNPLFHFEFKTDTLVYPSNMGNHFFIKNLTAENPYLFYREINSNIQALAYDSTEKVLAIPFPANDSLNTIYLGGTNYVCTASAQNIQVRKAPAGIATTDMNARGYVYNKEGTIDSIHVINSNNELILHLKPNGNHPGILLTGIEKLNGDTCYYPDEESTKEAYLARRVKIKTENPLTGTSTIRFYFTQEELTDLITRSALTISPWDDLADLSGIRCTKYSDADMNDISTLGNFTHPNINGTSIPVSQTGTFGTSGADIYYYADVQTSGFSTFYLHGGSENSALPVKLTSFDARCSGNQVILSWKTASETNNDYFTLEKSPDGYNYTPIGNVNGNGNSNTESNYSFTDGTTTNRVVYYRLKQTDFNGISGYFYPVAIQCEKFTPDIDYIIYPNPATDHLNIQFLHGLPQGEIEIYNTPGMLISRTSVSPSIDISGLSPGIYFIKIHTDRQAYPVKKFEKQN